MEAASPKQGVTLQIVPSISNKEVSWRGERKKGRQGVEVDMEVVEESREQSSGSGGENIIKSSERRRGCREVVNTTCPVKSGVLFSSIGTVNKKEHESFSGSKGRWIYLAPWRRETGRKRLTKLKPLNRSRLLEVMASCPSLCEIESDYIKQIGFILSPEGEEVTKALFYSDYIRRVVLQAEAELMKEGIRVLQGNATKDVIHDRRALRCHAECNDPQWRNCFEPFVNPRDEYSRGELSDVDKELSPAHSHLVLSWNLGGYNKHLKQERFKEELEEYDVMCSQETWLCDDPEPVDGFMGLFRGATRQGPGCASGGLITLASTRIANKFTEIKPKCHWLLAGQVDLYNVIGGSKQLLILNVYIQLGNVFDYNIQRGLFEEDLELLCTGNAGCLSLMVGDFNHKLDPNGSDNLYKELLAAAQIPRSIFPNVECSTRDLSLARTLGSLGMFCLNGRMKNDRPAKKTFRTGNQECPIDYAFVNT
ncbi:hypothetical protein NDU88_004925 [Pleurodeles waltl]|uniref:Endonuclease/exonuclease/phosphatase domain-containing protein n=1 Tax=Pleurodeles waltl TaxID=8319 RepID=A0AAV7PE00_PLEWA|nr:hypothetical protein NDU88_004925 [Pleurodeles waltl]